jgi:hypothetical protein
MTLVDASVWKRRLHLPGKDKEAARQRALQLLDRISWVPAPVNE